MPRWMERSYLDDLTEEARSIKGDPPDPPDPSEWADYDDER